MNDVFKNNLIGFLKGLAAGAITGVVVVFIFFLGTQTCRASDDDIVLVTTYMDGSQSAVDLDFEFPAGYTHVIADLYNLDEGLVFSEQDLIQTCCAETVTFVGLQWEDTYVARLRFIRIPLHKDGFESRVSRGTFDDIVLWSDSFIAASGD
jgi:hypothetical protein